MGNNSFHQSLKSVGVSRTLPTENNASYSIDGIVPSLVVFPRTVDEVSNVVSTAHDYNVSIIPYGGGTKMILGNVPRSADVVLGLTDLDDVVDYQPADMTATFQSGTSITKAQTLLAGKGQFLPIQTPVPDRATIGGVLATAIVGPASASYGSPRDWLIGIKTVSENGIVARAGGNVVKNVTGFDMSRLYTGSLGSLGVIVEATFKLAPKPDTAKTLVISSSNLDSLLSSVEALRAPATSPNALVIVNPPIRQRIGLDGAGFALLLSLNGRSSSVKQRITEVNKTLSDHQIDSNIELDQPQSEQLWQRLINLPWGSSEPPDFSIKFNSVPSDVASIMGLLDKTDLQHIVHGVIADFGLGTLRSLLWSNGNSAIDRPSFEAITLQVTQVGSRWVLERSPLQFKKEIDIWGIEPEGLPIMQRIKNRFDPKDIFNPGRFVSGL